MKVKSTIRRRIEELKKEVKEISSLMELAKQDKRMESWGNYCCEKWKKEDEISVLEWVLK